MHPMRDGIRLVFILLLSGLCMAQARPFPGGDVQQIYQRLLPQIEKIAAFDHHAHPGYADDPDVDAMAAPPNASEALRTRDDNPELAAAAKALFGYPYNDLSPDHAKWLLNKKAELKKQFAGTAYFNSILDKINIEIIGGEPRDDARLSRSPSAFPGYSSPTRSCGPLIMSVKPGAILTRESLFRCRRRCSTAGCSR